MFSLPHAYPFSNRSNTRLTVGLLFMKPNKVTSVSEVSVYEGPNRESLFVFTCTSCAHPFPKLETGAWSWRCTSIYYRSLQCMKLYFRGLGFSDWGVIIQKTWTQIFIPFEISYLAQLYLSLAITTDDLISLLSFLENRLIISPACLCVPQ
jgi:hypothetical protein